METLESGRTDSEKLPFEVAQDLSLSHGSSQEYRSVSKSLQPGHDQAIPPARYSYDQGEIASSLDSSILQEPEALDSSPVQVLDPLETSEDSAKDPVTVVTVRQAILTDSEPQLFAQEQSTTVQDSLLSFEVKPISESIDSADFRQGNGRSTASRCLGCLFRY